MEKKSHKKITFFLSLVLIANLIFLYYIKYTSHDIPLNEFSYTNLGNILIGALVINLIIGVILYLKRSRSVKKPVTIFTFILTITLVIAYISTFIEYPPSDIYYMNQQGNKLVDAALFTIYLFILFTFTSWLWYKNFETKRFVILKTLFSAIFMCAFFLFISYMFLQFRSYNSDKWELTKSDKNIAVVLGAAVWSDNQPSPSLSGRVDRAIELADSGIVGTILLTGGNAPGEMSESQVAFKYAESKGLDTSIVKIETLTTSTIEQISYIRSNLIYNKDFDDVIVVSDPYHLIRVLEISDFYNIDIKVAASKGNVEDEKMFYRQLRESIALFVFWCFAL
jgi:vancomycin permeability regulator SanA